MNKHTCEVKIGERWVKGWDKYCATCGRHFIALSSNGKYCEVCHNTRPNVDKRTRVR